MWTDVIPGILVAAAIFLIPGTVVLASCRVRPTTAIVAAPPVSLAIIALSTLVASVLGSAWDVRWAVGCTVGCAVLCGLWSWATPWGRRATALSFLSPAAAGQYLLGQVIGAVFMTSLYLTAFVGPDTIAQRYDNAFHLNAIEAIGRTGQATPMATGELLSGVIYPNAWHTAGHLVQELSGLGLTGSVHALALTTVLGVWPMSMWLLLEVLVRPSAVARLISGPLLLAFPGFPLVLLDWGLVYPTILGLAVAPTLAAVLVDLIVRRSMLVTPVRTCLVVGMVGVGVGIAHPGSALIALLIVLPIALVPLVGLLGGSVHLPAHEPTDAGARHAAPGGDRRAMTRRDLVWAALLVALVLAIVWIWFEMTPSTDTAPWSRFQTMPQAVGEISMGAVMGRPMVPLVAVITVTGVVTSLAGWTRDRRALLAMLGPAAVYLGSSALESGMLRDMLSGFFYRDNFRTAAALTLGTVPVAVAGLDAVVRRVGSLADRLTEEIPVRRRWPRVVSIAAVAVVGLGSSTALSWHVSAHPDVEAQFEGVAAAYETWEHSDLVSTDEFEMFEELPEHVPEDAYIVADPWEGGGLTYALGEREVNRFYMLLPRSPEERYFDQNVSRIAQKPQLCEVLPSDRPLYFLDLDEHRLAGNKVEWEGYEGYQGITRDTPGFDLVHDVGDVQLYEITAC